MVSFSILSNFQYFYIASHTIILTIKRDKFNEKYANVYSITYKILPFSIKVQPKIIWNKINSTKFSPNFMFCYQSNF